MPASTDKIAPPTAENEKCTTDAPTKKLKVNDCKLVSITLPNEGPLGLCLLPYEEGKYVIIDEVIPQSQAEKYGVLAGDIPIYNTSISSFVGGIGYISYETFLQRAKNVRPFVFSVLRHTIDKSGSTNQLSINEAAAQSELNLLDGACESSTQHEGVNASSTDVGQNNNKGWDAFASFMKNYESSEDDESDGGRSSDEDYKKDDLVHKSVKSPAHPKRIEGEGMDEDIHNKAKNYKHDAPVVHTPSITEADNITNNNAITPASSNIKLPIKRSLRKHITPPKRFVARPSKFGWKNDDGDKAFLENDVEYFSENKATEAKTIKHSSIKPSIAAANTCSGSNLSGVHCFGSSTEYKSIIFYEGSGYSLGKYQLASDAALAYDKAALSIGPYWDINFSSWDDYISARTLELKRRGPIEVSFTSVLEEISLRASEAASKVVDEAELNDSEWVQRLGSVAIHEERVQLYRSARTLLPKKDDRDSSDESILIYPEEGSMSSSLTDTSILCKDSWSSVELKQFEEGCIIEGLSNWAKVASHIPTKTKRQVYYHACLLLFGFHQNDLDRLRREHDAYHSPSGDKQHKNTSTNSDQTSVFSTLSCGKESRVSSEGFLSGAEWPVDMEEVELKYSSDLGSSECKQPVKRGRGRPKKVKRPKNSKKGSSKSNSLPTGVNGTSAGNYHVAVWYQGSQRSIGTFQTLEQATKANEIARNMLKKDGLQLSAEDCERNFKLAKEAALADVPDIFSSSGRERPKNLEVNECRDNLERGVNRNGSVRKRKLSRKMADALLDSEAKKKETIDQPQKKRQKETPKPTHEPGNDSKTTICTIVHNKQTFVAKICSHEGCTNVVTTGEVCIKHGARCSHDNCMNLARRDGVCYEHGATRLSRRFCEFEGCKNISVKGGLCKRHGAKVTVRICCFEGCTNQAHSKGGVCKRHGNPSSIRRCIVEGCNNQVQARGLCIRHGAKRSP